MNEIRQYKEVYLRIRLPTEEEEAKLELAAKGEGPAPQNLIFTELGLIAIGNIDVLHDAVAALLCPPSFIASIHSPGDQHE